jgi:CheY-like chemotaxis protein
MTDVTNGLVLIVDDEPDMRSTIAELLKALNFEVKEAGNGKIALECWEEFHQDISLILCDISMPEMDGLQFFKRALMTSGYLPIVMITAHAEIPRVTEALRLGAIDYLVKPFDSKELEKQVFIWQDVGRRHRQTLMNTRSGKMEGLMRVWNSESRNKKSS